MLQLEVVVVVVGLGSEANLLHLHLHLLGLHLLLVLLLLIEELAIVNETAYRRLGIGRNLHKVYTLLMGHVKSLSGRHHGATTLAYDTHFPNANLLSHAVLILHFVVLH